MHGSPKQFVKVKYREINYNIYKFKEMTTMDISDYIKTSMSDNESSLLSLHYLQEVLPHHKKEVR